MDRSSWRLTMKGYATKLIEITEQGADKIAHQWLKDVRVNPKTPTYHNFSDEKSLSHAIAFYKNFRMLFCSDKPFDVARKFFTKYADERYSEGIPLHEAIYALILMRRHIWLYAEFQAMFVTAVEHHQATESLTRTILMFDYAMYAITGRYEDLMKREMEERIRRDSKAISFRQSVSGGQTK
jgi:hypothetical protein